MTKSIKNLSPHLLLVIPFFLLLSIALYTQTNHFYQVSHEISTWIVLDLLLTIPFVYFLVIRKSKIPNTTVVPVIVLGLILGYNVLPADQHAYLDLFKQFGLPVIELSVFAFVVYKVRQAIQTFKSKKEEGVDFYTILQKTCKEMLPGSLSGFLVSEISVIYYGFLNWKKPVLGENEFTYHKRSGSPALFGALIFIVLVETISVHILLLQWSHLAAIILSILSVYTGFQLLGFSRSLSKRPIILEEDKLILRYGILNEAIIKLDEIESVELSRKALKWDDDIRKFSILGDLESHNVVIRCKEQQRMDGIYGLSKDFKTLAFFVDDKDNFKKKLEDSIQKVSH